MDEGEDPRNAAIRELREETGVRSAEIIAEVLFHLSICLFLLCYTYLFLIFHELRSSPNC